MARSDRRAALLLRSALGGCALVATAAAALPAGAPTTVTNTGGGTPVFTPGASTLDIKLNAARTVLQYTNFGIATGETVNLHFDNRSDLAVIHATQSAITVDGTLASYVGANYGGNVWLLSGAGVFIGNGASINVGGFLASTSIPDTLLDTSGPVLTPGTLSFTFGGGDGLVSVGTATIAAHGGSIALIAPSVTTAAGAMIGGAGTSTALYGAAQRYTVTFAQTGSNDLDLLSFEVPGLSDGSLAETPLVLAGTTSAGNVYVASVSQADTVRAVLSASGAIAATGAAVDGKGNVVLIAGGGIVNGAAAALFTDGTQRQDIAAGGAITATGTVTASATGNIDLAAPVSAAGSIKLRGLNVNAASLTAGQDVVVRAGDAVGSSDGYGYDAEGGQIQVAFASAGDDVLGTAWNGDTEFGSVVLAGTGGDAAGDPLGLLDTAGDGRNLRLTTTGTQGDVYLGRDGQFRGGQRGASFAFETPIDTLTTVAGSIVTLDAVGEVGVVLQGNAGLTTVTASGGIAALGATGDLVIGSVSGIGGVGVQANNVTIGTATAAFEPFTGNGLVVVNALTSATVGTANAGTDVLVIADNGNASVGTANAGDDVIIRAYGGGKASLKFANLGAGDAPDQDANQFSLGEGSITLFPLLDLDSNDSGRIVDIRATNDSFPTGVGTRAAGIAGPMPSASVELGSVDADLVTEGGVQGATFVSLLAEGNIDIGLSQDGVIDRAWAGGDITARGPAFGIGDLSAGGSAVLTAYDGDAFVGYGQTQFDLKIYAAFGTAYFDSANVGQDLVLSGAQVSFGNLYGNSDSPAPRDVTVATTAGDFEAGYVNAGRDLTLDIHGDIDVAYADAGGDLKATATGIAHFGGGEGGGHASAGQDLLVTAASVLIEPGTSVSAGRDALLTATTGDVRLGGVAIVGRDLSAIAANGLAQIGHASVGRDFLLDGAQVELGSLAGTGDGTLRNITINATAGDFLYDAPLAATNDIKISAGTVLLFDGLGAGRDIVLTGTADAAAAFGPLTAGRDIVLAAVGDIIGGDVGAGRDLTLTTLAGNATIDSATAGDDIRANGVLVDFGSATTTGLGSDREADGSNIVINAASVTLASADAVTDLIVDAADTIAIGFGASGATAGRDMKLTALAFELVDLTAGHDMVLTAGAGGIDVDEFPGGALTVGHDLVINASGTIHASLLTASHDIVLTGGIIDVGTATAGNDLTITATTGGIGATGPLTAGNDLSLDAENDLSVDSLSAGRDIGATAGGDLFIVTATAGDDIRTSGDFTDIGAATTTGLGSDSEGDGSSIVVAGGSVSIAGASAFTDLIVSAIDTIAAGFGEGATASAGRDLVLTAPGMEFIRLAAGRDLILTANAAGLDFDFDGAQVDAGRDMILTAAGTINAGTLSAPRDLVLAANGIALGTATAGRDLTVDAGEGVLAAYSLAAGDYLRLAGTTVDVVFAAADGSGTDTEADGANIIATGGDVTIGQAVAATDIQAAAAGTLTLGIGAIQTFGEGGGDGYYARAGNDIVLTGGTIVTGPMSAGRDIRATASGDLSAGPATAGRDIVLRGAMLAFSTLDAGRDLSLTATAGSFTSAGLTAVRDLTVDAVGVDLETATAGRDLVIISNGGTLGLGSGTAGDDATLTGGAITIGQLQATGLGEDVGSDGSNLMLAGVAIAATQLSAGTDIDVIGAGAVVIGQATAGRDVTVSGGTVTGGLQLSGRDVSVTSAGALAASAGLVATRDLSLTAGTTLSFATLGAGRDIALTAAVVQGGSVVATRDLTVMATTSITGDLFEAGRNLVLDPDQPIVAGTVRAGGNAALVGASIDVGTLDVGGVSFVQATDGGIVLDTFTGDGGGTLLATGRVDVGAATTGDLRILAGDLDVRTSLFATNLQVETPGQMIIGGVAGAGEVGFRLAAADMARLRVTGIANFYAGDTTQAPPEGTQAVPGGNLILDSFAYSAADLPRLAFFADRSHVIDVRGLVAPTGSGGAIQFGDANINGRFRPNSIYVSGGLGSAELVANCFGKVVAIGALSMFAVNDIIFGDSGFRIAVQGTDAAGIDIANDQPSTPRRTDDALFAVSTRFSVDAGGKVVSQNTASGQSSYVGVLLNATGATAAVVSVGNARVVDLSGSLIDSGGSLRSGPLVALAGELGPGGTAPRTFRFNGCVVGGGQCSGVGGGAGGNGETPSEALRIEDYSPPRPFDIADSPLTTVLIVDSSGDGLDTLTIGTEDNAIVIKKKPSGE